MNTNLGVKPLGRGASTSAVVAADVAHLKAKGAAMRAACAMFAGVERSAALRQVDLAFASNGASRGRTEKLFRELNLSF